MAYIYLKFIYYLLVYFTNLIENAGAWRDNYLLPIQHVEILLYICHNIYEGRKFYILFMVIWHQTHGFGLFREWEHKLVATTI